MGMRAVKRFLRVGIVAVALVPVAAGADWPTYHLDSSRSGNDTSGPSVTTVTEAWSLGVSGPIFAEPLVVGNTLIVATENNNVYAFNVANGATLWSRGLGTPVPKANLPCGNIDPVGITGTPVVDTSAGVMYVVAFLEQPSHHYELFALNLNNAGATLWHETLTAPNFDQNVDVEGQRGALALANGRVYVPFGGRWGDCGTYFGAVIAAPASGPGALLSYEQSSGAGIWATSGPAIDASGNVYVATGNSGCTNSSCFDFSESVVKLSPTLNRVDWFADPNWVNMNINDADLGSVGPAVIGSTLVFQAGKPGDGYLLNQASLGGTNPAFSGHVCPNQTVDAVFGGTAYAAPYLYVPCSAGLVALNVNTATPSFSVAWQGPGMSYSGPPIVAGGVVWTIDPAGTLYGLDPASGQIKFAESIGGAEHFATPASSGSRLFVPAGSLIVAYVFNAQPGASLSPVSLTFPTQNLGATTAPQTVTVTSTGLLPLSINGFQMTGDFAESDNCPTTLPSGASCTANVTFTPRSSGPLTGSLKLFDNASNSPQSVALSGTGGTFFAMASGPAVTNWGPGRLDVFARGSDNALWHKYYWAAGWSDWSSLGGQLASDPAAVSWAKGRIDVFAQASDNTLRHIYYDIAAGGWSTWYSHAGSINSAPAVSTWGRGRLDVFARGAANNDLQHIFYASTAGGWSTWYSHGGNWASRPAAVAWGPGRIDVFERGTDNALWHIYYAVGWSTWYSHAGVLNSGPAAASWGPGRLDVFMTGTDTALWHIYYSSGWSGWFSHAGALNADPAATAAAQGRLDVFGRGIDNGLRHIFYSSGWSGWYPY